MIKPDKSKNIFKDLTPKQMRDLKDKIVYRQMFGKKRSDDNETDAIFEKLKEQKLSEIK
jgi:hypothetical protein